VKAADDVGPLIDMGAAHFEAGQLDEAFPYFRDAYAIGQERAFKENPKKYLEFYLKQAKASKA
jgi:hypothetical protein